MGYLRVIDWEKQQHYANRAPPWIRLYNGLLDDYGWGRLSDAGKAHLIGLYLLASRTGNLIPADPEWIAQRIQATSPVDVEELVSLGFVERCENAPAQPVESAKPESKRALPQNASMVAKPVSNAASAEERRAEEKRADKSRAEEREAPGNAPPRPALPTPAALPPSHPVGRMNGSGNGRPPPPHATPKALVEPTPAELLAYAREIGYPRLDPEAFLAHYRTVGWRRGQTPITDWKPLVLRWKLQERAPPPTRNAPAGALEVGRRLMLETAKKEGLSR